MQGRVYTVIFDNVAVTVAQELFNINPAADKPCRLLALDVGQTNRTGDANEDMLRWGIIRMTGGVLTNSTGGTAPTPQPLNIGDSAAGFTARVNDTTLATTTGTSTTHHASCFNTRVGLLWVPPPECLVVGIDSAATGILLVRLLEAPTASTTFSGTAYIEELG